jgi:hypothetical protein
MTNKYLEKVASKLDSAVAMAKRVGGHFTGANVRTATKKYYAEFDKGSLRRSNSKLHNLGRDIDDEINHRNTVRAVAGTAVGGTAAGFAAGKATNEKKSKEDLEKAAMQAIVRNLAKGMGNIGAAAKGELRKATTFSTNIATKAKGAEFQSKGTMGMLADNRSKLAAGKQALPQAKANAKGLINGTRNQQWDARDSVYRK